jgi:hypothetical protein
MYLPSPILVQSLPVSDLMISFGKGLITSKSFTKSILTSETVILIL